MARHLTSAAIQTLLSASVGNLKPSDVDALRDALSRIKAIRATDGANGTGESTLTVLFPNGGLNP